MRDDRPVNLRNFLNCFGLTIAFLVPACAPGQESGFQDVLGLRGKGGAQDPVKFSASLESESQPGELILRISATIAPDHYIYSTTPGQGPETKIRMTRVEGLEAASDQFEADHPPEI